LKNTEFIPSNSFPKPLNWTWATTKGADLIWTPIPFQESMRIAYSRTHYGTGYYIYHLYADEENLSSTIRSWDIAKSPDRAVLDLISKAGTDIAPKDLTKESGEVNLNKDAIIVSHINTSPSVIRALKFTLPLDKIIELERLRLKVTWDNETQPSIDAPLCLFFGAGTFYNRENREYLVKGLPISVRFDFKAEKVELACYYPMPFFESAKIELTDIQPDDIRINYEIRYEPLTTAPNNSSYFHATYVDNPKPEAGKDVTFLDMKGLQGHNEWSGNFVGTSFIFSHNANLFTLEGDPRFFFDDSNTPQAYGTGTEEWCVGGDYWGGENMTLPLAGHPCGAKNIESATNAKDLIQSAYRFLIADLMPFGRRAVIKFEHGENVSGEHYESVTYWYGLPAPSLVKTDSVDVGNAISEKSHQYYCSEFSVIDTVTSRYEWGLDRVPAHSWGIDVSKIPEYRDKIGMETYPPHTHTGRHHKSSSEFSVQVHPENKGALLVRTLDHSFPNQTAEVYVADISNAKEGGALEWQIAGTWYLAGSNVCVYSRAPKELGARLYNIRTSNRSFRDDEFLIPANLTEGRSALRIRIKFSPDQQHLYPGFPFPKESAWSELHYNIYSYVSPDFRVKK
jgi:hypothetical protein